MLNFKESKSMNNEWRFNERVFNYAPNNIEANHSSKPSNYEMFI